MQHFIILLVSICAITFSTLVKADKVAVIGGGAAGVVSSYLIEDAHDVTLFEAQPGLGGHLQTELLTQNGQTVAIDAGAEYFNRVSYPNLVKLLQYLGIVTAGFTLTIGFVNRAKKEKLDIPLYHDHQFEWGALRPTRLWKLAQLKWVMIKGQSILDNKIYQLTIEDFVNQFWIVTADFKNDFFYPLLAAAWGLTIDQAKNLSAYQALKYLHDSESAKNQWMEVPDGFKTYLTTLENTLHNTQVFRDSPVARVTRENKQYRVEMQNGDSALFDQVVFAVSPNIAGKLLSENNNQKIKALSDTFSQVQTFDSEVTIAPALPENKQFMPAPNKVINIVYDGEHASMSMTKPWKKQPGMLDVYKIWTTYMNEAQKPNNPHAVYAYKHVHMNPDYYKAYTAARDFEKNTHKNLWFPGAHENDSHEETINAAIDVAKALAPESKRLEIFR